MLNYQNVRGAEIEVGTQSMDDAYYDITKVSIQRENRTHGT